jgi:deoxyribodipyrimidine photo-lyase
MVPLLRIRTIGERAPNPAGDYVLYWMTAFRRLEWNFSLDRALEWCAELRRPLLILEALRCDYPWASRRLHQFVLDGMAENAEGARRMGVAYYPYVEPRPGAGRGLLAALAGHACVAVTDDFPCYFLPRMGAAAARRLKVRLEFVDSNGLLPLRAAQKAFDRAFDFRRFLQRTLPEHLEQFPSAHPFGGYARSRAAQIPPAVLRRWPRASSTLLRAQPAALAQLPIAAQPGPALQRGGAAAARRTLRDFLRAKLENYARDRNHPDLDASSGLSPYLHFGHISAHQVFRAIMQRCRWSPERMSVRATGARGGWWGAPPPVEAFLDQLIIWRELGCNFCAHRADYARYDSLPHWARATLARHAADRRMYRYSLAEFEQARTHDPLWNAAQTQLLREGRLHNYLRMLWGKKILEWSPSPRRALAVMIELNNRYALDGRDPNSYSGISWCLGRYDRPWGPERPVFGTVRYMSSENTARKLRLSRYLKKYGSG